MNSTTPLKLFKVTAIAEGISYLALLFIAMPLKYFFYFPLAVKYTGWLHGILFMAYIVLLIACWLVYQWKFTRILLFFFASLMPFLPFWVEKKLKQEYPA